LEFTTFEEEKKIAKLKINIYKMLIKKFKRQQLYGVTELLKKHREIGKNEFVKIKC